MRQQLDLGDEEDDDIAEVNAALALGDLLRKEGERTEAQALFRRAGRGAQRLDYQHGIAEALVRQIEMLPRNTDLETMAALQRQASEAARRTADLGLQSRIVISLAETLRRNGKIPEAVTQLEEGLTVSRQIGDLAMEGRCLTTLAEIEHSRGRIAAAAGHERDLVTLEDRRGNRAGGRANGRSAWGPRCSISTMFPPRWRRSVAGWSWRAAAGDVSLEQRALGGIGMAYARAGRRSESLEHLMRALDLARAARDRRHEARWLATLGQVLVAIRAAAGGDARALRRARRRAAGGRSRLAGEHPDAARADVRRRAGRRPAPRSATRTPTDSIAAWGRPKSRSISSISCRCWPRRPGRFRPRSPSASRRCNWLRMGNDRLTEARLRIRLGRLAMSRGDTAAALDHFTKGVALAETMGQPAIQAQALSALAGAQAALKDPAAAVTYRRALNQARAGERSRRGGAGRARSRSDADQPGGAGRRKPDAPGGRRRGSPHGRPGSESGATGRRPAGRDRSAGASPDRPRPAAAHRREAAAQREPRVEPGTDVADAEPPPAETAQESSGDAVFRETTLPPL